MRDICKNAKFVFVWLGMPSNDSDLAMQTIRKIGEDMIEFWGEECDESPLSVIASVSQRNGLFFGDANSKGSKAWIEVKHLLCRTWLSRAWVAQEVCWNKQVVIFCGTKNIGLWDLCFFLDFDTHLAVFSGNGAPHKAQIIDRRADSLNRMRKQASGEGGYPLLEALQNLRVYNCQKGHDKVYATLGLACDLPVGAIRPDYSKSVVEVYMDVVRYCLRSAPANHWLDFLGMIIRPAPDSEKLHPGALNAYLVADGETTPTWVPDWRQTLSLRVLPKTFWDGDKEDKVYNASKRSKADASIEERRLLINGIYVDSIASVSSIAEDEDFEFRTQRNWTPSQLDDEYPTGETVNKALMSTFVADVEYHSDVGAIFRDYNANWTPLDDEKFASRENDGFEMQELVNSISGATTFRRFIRTKKGYMGLAPAAAAIGDKICVLFGGQVLYVLRQNNDGKTHEFMGECYVHGLMDGQAMDMPTEDHELKPEPEVFVLV